MDNTKSFKALEGKLGRYVTTCDLCGTDLLHRPWMIAIKDRHNVLPEDMKLTCNKCFAVENHRCNR